MNRRKNFFFYKNLGRGGGADGDQAINEKPSYFYAKP